MMVGVGRKGLGFGGFEGSILVVVDVGGVEI